MGGPWAHRVCGLVGKAGCDTVRSWSWVGGGAAGVDVLALPTSIGTRGPCCILFS